jgi:ubiquinone/menaquinone biosynthesis C-methylase UbiE
MVFCISYFDDLQVAFKEAHRVLKKNGVLVVGFLDRESTIGKEYEQRKATSIFYKSARFYSVDKVLSELKQARFRHFNFCQTLFQSLNEIKELEPCKIGYGEGSFVVIQARKG